MKRNYSSFYKKSLISKLIHLLAWPIAMLSKILPKKNVALFSSMNGYLFADNSKYLYQNYTGNKFWITKNKELVNLRKDFLYAYSLKGIFLQIVAQKVYFTHGVYDFVPFLIWGAEKINLWHGVPLKEIGPLADDINTSTLKKCIKKFFYFIFPYMYYMACDKVICPDKNRISDYKRYFSVSDPELIFRKQPRNEFAIQHIRQKKILISPTYRKGDSAFILTYLLNLCPDKIGKKLVSLGYSIIFRPHPIDIEFFKNIKLPDYIEIDNSTDLYESITSYSIVLTDYSSIYYDCKELNIPCFIFAPDLDNYIKNVGLNSLYINELKNKLINRMENIENLF